MLPFFVNFALAGAVSATIATLVASGIGRSGFPLPLDDRRLGCVDGLRGYLAVSVLIHHFFIWIQATRLEGTWSPPSINGLNQLGAGSVGLFFMTTGLVFYPRVLRGFGGVSWPAVYTTRVFRIVPLIAASLSAITLLIVLRTGGIAYGRYPLDAAKWISTWGRTSIIRLSR